MDKTINQIKFEFKEIATKHKQINDFFFGSFMDAVSDQALKYPVMIMTFIPSQIGKIPSMRKRTNNLRFALTIADKYNEDNFRQIDEIHSDTFTILGDVCSVLESPRFEDYVERIAASPVNPFIEKGPDLVAGNVMNLDLSIFDDGNFCSIPFEDYNFETSQFKGCNV